MILEPIGIATLIAGFLVFQFRSPFAIYLLAITNVFGAAAAFKLPMLGGASAPPGAVFLVFVTISAALNGAWRRAALATLAFPRPGFWFLVLVVYGVLSALFLPRIFAGLTHIYAIGRDGNEGGFVTLDLTPSTGNITQTLYFCADLVCFAVIAGYARLGGGPIVVRALLAAAALTLFFALADLLTYATDTKDLLSFIRNANYRMLDTGEIGGLKRIVGSFPEAGAYSYTALGFYAFALGLWLEKYPARHCGLLAWVLLITLLFSTSTTAYVSLALVTLAVFFACLWRLVTGRASGRQIGYLFTVAFGIPFVVLAAMLVPPIWDTVSELYNVTVVNKLDSQSGLERMRWNTQALIAFFDTSGWGAGLGSVRASSFLVAILSNLGLVGLVLFVLFLSGVTLPHRGPARLLSRNAAVAACLASLIAASIMSGSVDLGLLFSIFAGLSAAFRERRPETGSSRHMASPFSSSVSVRPV